MNSIDNPYYVILKELCKTCYDKNDYQSLKFKDNRMKICEKRSCTNTKPIYVNVRNYKEYLRDFQNNSKHPTSEVSICKRENCVYSYEKCYFAHNNFEYFVWNRMITFKNGTKKVSEIFDLYIQPYIYEHLEIRKISTFSTPIQHSFHQEELVVPQSDHQNKLTQDSDKRKHYFCWFCMNYTSSAPNISIHVEGKKHKMLYEADKKRRWYFKMPKDDKNIVPCRNSKCSCDSAHSDEECKEMIARIKFRNSFTSFEMPSEMSKCLQKKISILPKWMQITIPKFPNRIECYTSPLEVFVNLKILNSGFNKLELFLSDDESRPYFKLIKIDDTQISENNGQLLRIDLNPSSHCKVDFGIRFSPEYSSTYRQRILFRLHSENKEFKFCERIRVDVGTSNQLKLFKDNWKKYRGIITKEVDVKPYIPLNIDENKSSILSEDLLYHVTSIPTNPNWINTTVQNYNYCYWMRDMMVLEELEQRFILSLVNTNFTMEIKDHFQISNDTYYPVRGQLFGFISFLPDHDLFARKLITENVMTGYFTVSDDLQNTQRFEFQIVNLMKSHVETRSVKGFTMNLSQSTVEILGLTSNTELDINIVFDFDRFAFELRHVSLNNVPKFDKLAYNPLSCPYFTRLPYGETESEVSFNPHQTLNIEQRRLPLLVLRKLNSNEIALPFVLNGSFGTGKTLLIAETVIEILKHNQNSRILICTRSYSAAEKYLEIFEEHVEDYHNLMKLIRKDVAKKAHFKFRDMIIYNDKVDEEIQSSNHQFFDIPVLITTLDNAADFLAKFLKFSSFDFTFQYIFLDEAAQVLETHAIMVYQFGNQSSKFVFAGDIYQTNAEIYNKKLEKYSIPIIRRLYKAYMKIPEYKICLIEVYRTHPNIVKFLSDAIYYPSKLTSSMKPPHSDIKSMNFWDTTGIEAEFDETFGSFQNSYEAETIVCEISNLLTNHDWIQNDDILVCSPFYSQVRLIREYLKNKGIREINVELPSGIQGKEFGFVFLSPVLTQAVMNTYPILHQTFHDSKNLINVVISRAKHFVEVVGDFGSLLNCATWQQWDTFVDMCLNS